MNKSKVWVAFIFLVYSASSFGMIVFPKETPFLERYSTYLGLFYFVAAFVVLKMKAKSIKKALNKLYLYCFQLILSIIGVLLLIISDPFLWPYRFLDFHVLKKFLYHLGIIFLPYLILQCLIIHFSLKLLKK